jgi:hypothetical protein
MIRCHKRVKKTKINLIILAKTQTVRRKKNKYPEMLKIQKRAVTDKIKLMPGATIPDE